MVESTEVAKPVDFQTVIRDRIKSEFVSLIDDDSWDALVKAALDNFLHAKDHNGYRFVNVDRPSEMDKLITEELSNQAAMRVAKEVAKHLDGKDFAEILKSYILDNSDRLLAQACGAVLTAGLESFSTSISQMLPVVCSCGALNKPGSSCPNCGAYC